ncbi:hypothetical protein [Aurantiacibacter sp. MUD61]|uniref:hypothetical protein n=1 Tax=Aurantiacibacter sp. MUD61 TaxID=3009083 RepID=UPI0022F0A2ED|nr:hypothetical protein [Aurantiacibacter sp. MUD61]
MIRHSMIASVAATALLVSACGEMGADGEAATLIGDGGETGSSLTLVYGNDNSEWANDGECDDARFQGDAMASVLNTDNIGQDASDCEAAMQAGDIELNPYFAEPASDAAINFGDDEGMYPNDDECDDIRFTGEYAPNLVYLPENIGHDASDCRAAVESGEARWQGATATPEYGVTLDELESSSY